MNKRENQFNYYQTRILQLENQNKILLEQLIKYDIATPRQIIVNNANVSPIIKKELSELKQHLKEIEWYLEDTCNVPICVACGNTEKEGHAKDCWLAAAIKEGE